MNCNCVVIVVVIVIVIVVAIIIDVVIDVVIVVTVVVTVVATVVVVVVVVDVWFYDERKGDGAFVFCWGVGVVMMFVLNFFVVHILFCVEVESEDLE